MKYLHILNTDGKRYGGSNLKETFDIYSDLEINENIKESIKNRIFSEKDFEIDIHEMLAMLPAFESRIDELLNHPDFNPFKEELRGQFPEQFGNQPFEYKGTTYYLYHKGRAFYVDSIISNTNGFKNLIEEHLRVNKPLKYIFKDL
jgi:hypothetical protein